MVIFVLVSFLFSYLICFLNVDLCLVPWALQKLHIPMSSAVLTTNIDHVLFCIIGLFVGKHVLFDKGWM